MLAVIQVKTGVEAIFLPNPGVAAGIVTVQVCCCKTLSSRRVRFCLHVAGSMITTFHGENNLMQN